MKKRNKQKSLTMLLIALVMAVLTLTACGSDKKETDLGKQNNGEKTDIAIGLDPYDYATVPAYLSEVILEQEGFDVEIVEADVGVLYEALSSQDIDAFIDIWRPNLHESYLEKYGDTFVSAGTLYSDMPLGMAVPSYMEDINTIEDVAANPELFNNEIYAIDPGSGMAYTTEVMVEDYEMTDFEIKNSSTAAMLSQVETVMESEEGIAFNAWRPHPMFVRYDIKFLEDPLGSWKKDDVEIGVTLELEKESPTAFKLFSNMKLSLDMVEVWLLGIEDDKTPRELAEEWVEENQDTVNEWLEK